MLSTFDFYILHFALLELEFNQYAQIEIQNKMIRGLIDLNDCKDLIYMYFCY